MLEAARFGSRTWSTFALLGCVTLLPAMTGCERERLDVAQGVDLDRFQGKWHEIGHIPRPAQSDCTGTTATYTKQGNGTFSFVHECTLTNGGYHGSTATAKMTDAAEPAKLEVDFGGYVGEYWILEVASDYRYAVVGHPSREYLWILSRTRQMDALDMEAALRRARQQNFDTNRLEYTPQGPEPQGTPAPAPSYGCALGAGTPPSPYGSSLLLVAALAMLGWRSRVRRNAA